MKAVTASQSTNNFKVVCLNKEVLYTALVHNKMSSSFANAATTIILNELSNNILNCIAKFWSVVPFNNRLVASSYLCRNLMDCIVGLNLRNKTYL